MIVATLVSSIFSNVIVTYYGLLAGIVGIFIASCVKDTSLWYANWIALDMMGVRNEKVRKRILLIADEWNTFELKHVGAFTLIALMHAILFKCDYSTAIKVMIETAITFQVRLDLGIVAIVYAFYIIIWNLYVMLQARRLETAIREKINSELEN